MTGKVKFLCLVVFLACVSAALMAQDAPTIAPDQDYYADALVDNALPYVGEQIVYSFRFYSANAANPSITSPTFEGFWRSDQQTTRYAEIINGRQYVVTVTDVYLTPIRSGRLIIEATLIDIPETVFNDAAFLQTEAIALDVQALPQPAPENFDGAVGQFTTEVSVNETTVTLGEPVTLTYRVRGNGNLEQIPAPDLVVPEGWRAYPNPSEYFELERGTITISERRFEWRIVPDQTGTHEFPAYAFTYFDPQTETYKIAETLPFSIDVLPGSDNLQQREEIVTTVDATFALKSDYLFVDNAETMPDILFWLLFAVPPLVLMGAWSMRKLSRYNQAQRIKRRQQNALKVARRELQNASNKDDAQAFAHVSMAIMGYMSDRFMRDDLMLGEIDMVLAENAVDTRLRQQLMMCLSAAEDGRYAPTGLHYDVIPLVKRTAETLLQIEQSLEEQTI